MKSIVTKKWFSYFLLLAVLVFFLSSLRTFTRLDNVIVFYLESIMILISVFLFYAILKGHSHLKFIVRLWSSVLIIPSSIAIVAILYYWMKYSQYDNQTLWHFFLTWGVRFIFGVIAFVGSGKWIKELKEI